MGDFIKELNIIDFLGIAIPGAFLVLMLSGETPAHFFLSSYLGEEYSEATKVIVLLILGYIVGGLIHEAGDLAEKLLWSCSLTDPKTYAIWKVGPEQLKHTLNLDGYSAPSFSIRNVIKLFVGMLCFSLYFIFSIDIGANCSDPSTILAIEPGILILIVFIVSLIMTWGYGYFSRVDTREAVELIRARNAFIQTTAAKQEKYSKCVLFDGFRVVMRNLMIAIAVINFSSHFVELPVRADVIKLVENSVLKKSIIVLIIVMSLRYFHYSYLKYKYAYELFLDVSLEKKLSSAVTITTPSTDFKSQHANKHGLLTKTSCVILEVMLK